MIADSTGDLRGAYWHSSSAHVYYISISTLSAHGAGTIRRGFKERPLIFVKTRALQSLHIERVVLLLTKSSRSVGHSSGTSRSYKMRSSTFAAILQLMAKAGDAEGLSLFYRNVTTHCRACMHTHTIKIFYG